MPHITNLVTNTTLNAEINGVKTKKQILSITNLTATATLNVKINEVKKRNTYSF